MTTLETSGILRLSATSGTVVGMTKWALVTGASAGIGKEFCEQLAARGDNVVLVARRADRLEELKAHLEKRYRVHAEVLAADLANPDDLKRVAERVAQASDPIEVLVNNAGFGLKTAFLDTDVEKEIASVDVMVKAVVVLSHAAGRAMRERGRGAIINVSSVAGFMASGTYSAAKSYVTVFSESLAGQLAGTGVTVTALCPGFTHTDFHASADIDVDKTSAIGKRLWLDADRLVRDCLADVDAGRVISVPGKQYKVATQLLRHVPRSIVRAGALSNRHRPRD